MPQAVQILKAGLRNYFLCLFQNKSSFLDHDDSSGRIFDNQSRPHIVKSQHRENHQNQPKSAHLKSRNNHLLCQHFFNHSIRVYNQILRCEIVFTSLLHEEKI